MPALPAIGVSISPAKVNVVGAGVNLIGNGVNLPGGPSLRPGGPVIHLSNATIADNATIGTVIGALSVTGGTGSYTYTLTSNPGGLFGITGSNLTVAAALTAGSDPISIKADNGAGSTVTQPFLITVTSSGTNGPMDFSVPGNVAITAAVF